MPQLLSKSHCTWHRRPVQGPVTPRRFGPVSGGAITGVLPGTSSRLPPAPCRWSHNWRATRHHHPGCHRPRAGGATTGVLQGTIIQAATGPAPVEPQRAYYQAHHPGCHRPRAGGATTGVLSGTSSRLPPAPCRWSHNWRAIRHIIQAATGPVPVEPQLACYKAPARFVGGRVDGCPTHRRNRDRNPPAARRPSAPGQVAG